ncbi:MAG: helix-turn-helix domain-containing protein [bacterium]
MVESMHTAAYAALIEAVVQIRHEAGLTQRQLADHLGREQSFVGRIETGQRRIDLVEFVWICKACGADPQEEINRLVSRIARQVPGRSRRRSR